MEEKLAANADKDYVKARLLEMVAEAKSEMWLESFTKSCPRCWSPVQVTNFMTKILEPKSGNRMPLKWG